MLNKKVFVHLFVEKQQMIRGKTMEHSLDCAVIYLLSWLMELLWTVDNTARQHTCAACCSPLTWQQQFRVIRECFIGLTFLIYPHSVFWKSTGGYFTLSDVQINGERCVGWFLSLTWVSVEERDSLSSGNEGVKLAEMGVPGMPLAWTCSLSLPTVPSSSSELWVSSVPGSDGCSSAGLLADSFVSEQRFTGSRQWPEVTINTYTCKYLLTVSNHQSMNKLLDFNLEVTMAPLFNTNSKRRLWHVYQDLKELFRRSNKQEKLHFL